MTSKQKVSKRMRPTYLKLIPDVVERLSLLEKPINTASIKRLAEARHAGFDLTDEDIQSLIPQKETPEKLVPMSLF